VHKFSFEQASPWGTWQLANVLSARHSSRICRVAGVVIRAGTLVVPAIVAWLA
jgi:hypothetical protein